MSSTKSSPHQDLTISVTVNRSPQEVYDAITNVSGWWIGDISGRADQVGSQFTYRYKHFHVSTQRVTELIPSKRVVWHVNEATLSFTKDKNEWTGTDIIFEISTKGGQTEIQFVHRGLTPEVECFEACSSGWEFYITKSLKSYLMTGKGLDPGF